MSLIKAIRPHPRCSEPQQTRQNPAQQRFPSCCKQNHLCCAGEAQPEPRNSREGQTEPPRAASGVDLPFLSGSCHMQETPGRFEELLLLPVLLLNQAGRTQPDPGLCLQTSHLTLPREDCSGQELSASSRSHQTLPQEKLWRTRNGRRHKTSPDRLLQLFLE